MENRNLETKKNGVNAGKVSILQTVFRIILGLNLLVAGIGHLTFQRLEFVAQVPKWMPINEDIVVVLSGIVEILLGSSLVVLSKYRVQIGWVVAAFFILVFPGNISQYKEGIDAFGLNSDKARGIRLLFQPVLVVWALWCTGSWRAWMNKRKNK